MIPEDQMEVAEVRLLLTPYAANRLREALDNPGKTPLRISFTAPNREIHNIPIQAIKRIDDL